MTTYRCEICGGELEFSPDGLSGKCLYCGNTFFFQEKKSEAQSMALNRAAEMRRRCDFDSAMTEYQVLLQQTPKDAEAHWGMVLSIYGIEYVDDPRTHTPIPTCRRTMLKSIYENEHYQKAIQYASLEQRAIYEHKAAVIDRLQKKIKHQLEDEEDYDVFISFKSTDENGYPTKDRQIARNLYDALSAKGIRTFYSEVTLADRIGEDFEPIIYKALYSSKCFILVATSEAYLNAVWVKNEWARFRDRITDERLQGAAFAVFENIAPNALPPFLRTQGIDLAKYPAGGYAEQIADNLAKKWGIIKEESDEAKRLRRELEDRLKQMESYQSGGVSIEKVIARAYEFLKEKSWKDADHQAERALDFDGHSADAYLIKLLCELQLPEKEALAVQANPFDDSANYKRAVQYADPALHAFLTTCAENAKKEKVYLAAQKLLTDRKNSVGVKCAAIAELQKIPGYKDADSLRATAEESVYRTAISLLESAKEKIDYQYAAEIFGKIPTYWDAAEKQKTAQKKAQKFAKHEKGARVFLCVMILIALAVYALSCFWLGELSVLPTVIASVTLLVCLIGCFYIFPFRKGAAACLCAACVIISSFFVVYYTANDGFHRYQYTSVEDGIEITSVKYPNMAKNTMAIPATIDGKPVTSIADGAFSACVKIKNLTIPNSVLRVGESAFSGVSIETATIPALACRAINNSAPKNVVITGGDAIGENAFLDCTSLTTVIISDSITKISRAAFSGCTNLTGATIADSVTSIGLGAFANCTSLQSIAIPKGVESIGASAFTGCTNLTKVIIPNGVVSIKDSAFSGCTSLTSITIPESVTDIGASAFSGCASLREVSLPGRITEIANNLFCNCRQLTQISFHGTVSRWNSISKGTLWNYNTPAYTVICTNGTATR